MTEAEFERAYVAFRLLVVAVSYRHFSIPRDEAEDIAQEVFLRLYLRRDSFSYRSDAELKGWLITTLRRMVIDISRRKRRVVEIPLDVDVTPNSVLENPRGLEALWDIVAALPSLTEKQQAAIAHAASGYPMVIGRDREQLRKARIRLRSLVAE